MVGSYIQFVRNLTLLGVRKRGRPPVFNANQFYPWAIERQLMEMTSKQFLQDLENNIAIALKGENFGDTLEDLSNNPSSMGKDFVNRLRNISNAVSAKVSADFARQSEMTVGQPYYPPAAKDQIFRTWEQNFINLCVSAEEDAKKKISSIVAEGKMKGWNKNQVENLIRQQLPAETKHRAELIARTELGKLNSAARIEQFKEVGIKYYRWMTTCDGRERHSHKLMNGMICSVSNPNIIYEETPDGLVEKPRTSEMFIGNPGEDFQCRCSMISWDPELDGKYQVKGPTAEEIRKQQAAEEAAKRKAAEEAARLERERLEREEAERAARAAAERKLEILRKANKRHESRTAEQEEAIQARWDERARLRRLAEAAKKRHASRTNAEENEIIRRLNNRLTVRKLVNSVIAEAEGINGVDLDKLKELRKGGSASQYVAMNNLANEIRQKLNELKALLYVQDPIKVAKDFDYATAMTIEKSVEAKLQMWENTDSSLAYKKKKLEYEIQWVEKYKKFPSWKVAQDAYKKLLSDVIDAMKNPPVYGSTGEITWNSKKYSKASKDSALWGDGVKVTKQDVDDILRPVTEGIWKKATVEEKIAATNYTMGSGGFNRPLRGYDGNWDPSSFKGVGNVSLNNEGKEQEINSLTSLINKSKLKQDTWLSRGWESRDGAAAFLNITRSELQSLSSLSQKELNAKFLNQEFTDYAFGSCGSSKGSGFHGALVGSVYCPRGTKALYAEPFSHYNGDSLTTSNLWDGKTKYPFQGEFETLLQRGTTYKCKKVYFSGGQLYMDFEIVKQHNF